MQQKQDIEANIGHRAGDCEQTAKEGCGHCT